MASHALRVPQDKTPTMFNEMAFSGAQWAGTITTTALAAAVLTGGMSTLFSGATLLANLGASLAGGIVGGYVGKEKMKYDLIHGKTVKEPSMLNMGLFTGLMGGVSLGVGIAYAVFAMASAATFTAWAPTIAIGTAVMTPLITYFNAKEQYNLQQKEYDQAEHTVRVNAMKGKSPEVAILESQRLILDTPQPAHRKHSYMGGVSDAEMLLMEKLFAKKGEKKSFVETLEEQRATPDTAIGARK